MDLMDSAQGEKDVCYNRRRRRERLRGFRGNARVGKRLKEGTRE